MRALIVAVLLLFIIGCSSSNIPFLSGGKQTNIDVNAKRSGTQGLQLAFLSERPSASYVIGETGRPITLAVSAENKGYADVQAGYLVINFDDLYFDFDKRVEVMDLLGKTIQRPAGEKRAYFFDGTIAPLIENRKSLYINAIACYAYETKGEFDVCIDVDPAGTKPLKKACDLSETSKKLSGLSGQGGPVAITQVDQTIAKKEGELYQVEFIVRVRNAANGDIHSVQRSALDLCTGGDNIEKRDLVEVSANLAGQPLECESPIIVRKSAEGYSTCRGAAPVPGSTPAYVSRLEVTLRYDYVENTGRGVVLTKLGAKV